MLFPNAVIVNIVRDPLDAIWELYRHRDGGGGSRGGAVKSSSNPSSAPLVWTYDLNAILKEFHEYVSLMGFWRKTLPSQRIVDISYQKLMSQKTLRSTLEMKILKALNLKWEDQMLDDNLFETKVSLNEPHGSWVPYSVQLSKLRFELSTRLTALRKDGLLTMTKEIDWDGFMPSSQTAASDSSSSSDVYDGRLLTSYLSFASFFQLRFI
jgi:hypothetical protein